MTRKEFFNLLPFLLFTIVFTLVFSNKPFFWDKDILDSKQAHWLIQSHFNFVFPNEIDPGHPPFIGTLLAVGWTLFGKSLLVSHLLVLPFSLGIVLQAYLLIKRFTQKWRFVILFLVLLDTSLLTQMIVISSDLVILFFLLLCINTILSEKNRQYLTLGLMGLALVNMRGMVLCAVVLLFDISLNYRHLSLKKAFRLISVYIPGGMLAIGFIVFHYLNKGWVMTHEGSPWLGCFEPVDMQGLLRNIIIFFWRIGDYGKFIYGLLLIPIVVNLYKGKWKHSEIYNSLLILLLILALSYLPYFRYHNLLSHRYLLPFNLMLSIFILTYLANNVKNIKWVFISVLIVVGSGSFWIYPDKIAQGWDATLAHIPYHKLHKEMLGYLNDKNIQYSEIGTVTPNLSKLKYAYLNDDERSFVWLDLNENKFVLYSNVFNDFTDAEIDELQSEWIKEKQLKKHFITLTLFKNPQY